jgi:hypothetical protein
MANLDNKYLFCEELTDDIIEILTVENRFEFIEKSMPDMLMCDFNNSSIFPKSIEHPEKYAVQCCFTVYPNKTVFSVVYFPFEDCKNIVSRLNRELPNINKKINSEPKFLSVPVNLSVIDNLGMCLLQKTKDKNLRRKMLKFQIDNFFKSHADRIIHKILEIFMNVRI